MMVMMIINEESVRERKREREIKAKNHASSLMCFILQSLLFISFLFVVVVVAMFKLQSTKFNLIKKEEKLCCDILYGGVRRRRRSRRETENIYILFLASCFFRYCNEVVAINIVANRLLPTILYTCTK